MPGPTPQPTPAPVSTTGARARAEATPPGSAPDDVVDSLHRATNAHDLDGIVAHFAPGYVLDDPCQPDRAFTGRGQVHRNWSEILGAVRDLTLVEHGRAVSGSQVWTDIEMRGHRPDGSDHRMRGVMVFDVDDGLITAGRFFVRPVLRDGLDADAAVRSATSSPQVGP